ncbi:helix-turn-helix and ligand-binding sensor domain-containing protein [Flavobacterium silvaticum]|uniref:Regulator n=1 Tax=Flavobacterium silvaticum TaxID=1852020 RepID=A0A972JHW8_9FLAO|nr:triple tyrosine motif-containing protein [Flavobacterium silvaticum]NMH29666.1 regulator [Flavobacterium silvaticum]
MTHFFRISLLLICIGLNAQIKTAGQPVIKNFTKSQYNGGTQSWKIAQSSNGSIYMANNAGLLEFDGSYWHTYPLPSNNGMRALRISNDTIYIGGYNEFGYFKSGANGLLTYTSLSALLPKEEKLLIDNIWKIHSYKGRIIFQSFDRNYVYYKKILKTEDAPGKFQFSFSIGNKLIIQDIETGLFEYTLNGLIPLPNTSKLKSTEIWSALYLDKKSLLLATLDKGLLLYNGNDITEFKSEANDFLKKNSCLGAEFIDKDYIVFNSVLNGVIITDRRGKIIQHINQENGLQNNTVLSSYVDRDKNLWLGLDNGISLIVENTPLTFLGSNYNLSTVYASVIYNKILYVATNQGLFMHKWDDSFFYDPFKLVSGTTGQAWNIEIVNGILLCSHNRGLMKIEGSAATEIIDADGYWGVKPIPDKPGKYIGANYSGFSVLSNAGKTLRLDTKLQGIAKSINTFDVDGTIVWLRKDNILYKCSLSSNLSEFKSIKAIEHLYPKDAGITSLQRINGQLTFQSENRFFTYDLNKQSFGEITSLSSLFSKIPPIRMATQDRFGNIWFSYKESFGLLKKNNTGYEPILSPFSSIRGLLVTDYISVNANTANDILIGLTNGLAHYDSQLNTRHSRPSAIIRSFVTVKDSTAISRLKAGALEPDIPFRNNNVRFTFSSPQFDNLENIEFSYRLNGFEEDWSRWTSATNKEYTNLHEGDYTMELRTRNTFGEISPTCTFSFSVSPPWYRHWLAYVLYLCMLAAAAYFTNHRIQLHIRRNKYFETVEQRRIYLEKEAKIRQDQLELEKQIEQLKNEKLRMRIISKDKELVNNSLQVVKKNKILNGIIHKMKEIDSERLDETARFQLGKVNKSILKEVNADKSWKDLEKHIRNVHFEFLKRLKEKHPAITPRELDLSTYLLMNMSTKEIAEIMNISSGGVELARYRLRKKLELAKNENLTGFLMSI